MVMKYCNTLQNTFTLLSLQTVPYIATDYASKIFMKAYSRPDILNRPMIVDLCLYIAGLKCH